LFVCVPGLKKKEEKKLNTPRFFGRYTQLERKKTTTLRCLFFFSCREMLLMLLLLGRIGKKIQGVR
jgi:hypothetical protein